jgi:chromosome segregation ATPase
MLVSNKIQHPLRTITISYDELKPFHPHEEEMLTRYTMLHNFVSDLYNEYNTIEENFETHNKHVQSIASRHKIIKAIISRLENHARLMITAMIPDKDAAKKVTEDAKEFNVILQEFHVDVEQVAEESAKMQQLFKPLDGKDERFTEIFEEYKQFRKQLDSNNNDYALDHARYNNDEKEFFDSLANIAKRQDVFIQNCNTVIDNFNALIDDVEKTYEQWEKYNDMIEMIKLMVVTPHDVSKLCLN